MKTNLTQTCVAYKNKYILVVKESGWYFGRNKLIYLSDFS